MGCNLETDQLDPRQWFGTFSFTRPAYCMYEVAPGGLGERQGYTTVRPDNPGGPSRAGI
jgi:hypothetical protein